MEKITVKKLFRGAYKDLIGKELELTGWVRTRRTSKKFGFIELNDGSFFKNIQIVFDESLDNWEETSKLSIGSAIKVVGELVESPGAKQAFEIHAKTVELVGDSELDYPIQKKRHTFEHLRTIAHLRPRTNTFTAVFRLRSVLAYAVHSFFNERGFVYVHTPIITGSDCEGAGELFQITTLDMENPPKDENGNVDYDQDFFGKKAYLTVSGQLEVEAYCMNYKNVYTFSPAFRAENSNTPRHLSELWMIDAEIGFADINDDMDLAEDMMKYIINYVMDTCPEEMEFFNKWIDKGVIKRLENVVNSEFERLDYTEAVEILKKAKQDFEFPVKWGVDLQTEHERYLTEQHFKKPVFVINYPKDIKAFYMRLNDDNKTVAAMDLLVPGVGEIIGGSQREERHDVLLQRIKESGLDEEDYWWYLDLRKYGGTPHAGYGLGFERAVMYLTGMKNIRDVIPFPRVPNSAEF
jgi:asparaginyl-tRNA synthetase